MTPPQYILLPVNPFFITFSLVVAFLLNLMPWGHFAGIPDFVALVLLFWNIHQPRKVGMGIAFLLGLLMDVHNASLLGEHALAYTLLAYGAIKVHRRVRWMRRGLQIFTVAPLLIMTELVPFAIRLLAGAAFPGWSHLLHAFVEAALWPVACTLLLMPQRRPPHPDDTRPI